MSWSEFVSEDEMSWSIPERVNEMGVTVDFFPYQTHDSTNIQNLIENIMQDMRARLPDEASCFVDNEGKQWDIRCTTLTPGSKAMVVISAYIHDAILFPDNIAHIARELFGKYRTSSDFDPKFFSVTVTLNRRTYEIFDNSRN